MTTLTGKTIAILATDGFEQVELTEPKKALEKAGARVDIVSPKSDSILGVHHQDKGDSFGVDKALSAAKTSDYDGLVLPGGVFNPDALRMNEEAVGFVESFFSANKPVAAICHGPWTLVEAGVVDDRTLTSWPSLKTDIENAGGSWVDQEVCVDRGLVTSRNPDDLPAFCNQIVEQFASA